MKRMRLAWAGCGSFATLMARVAGSVSGIEIVACFDTDPERSAWFSSKFHVSRRAESFAELLESGADGVYLPVPHSFHAPYAGRALEAGLHVLVEKPLALSEEDAVSLLAAAEAHGKVLAVNFHNRYHPAAERFVHRVRSGAVGRPIATRVIVPWSRPYSYAEPGSWHASKSLAGGGTLMTHAIHALDVALRAQHAPVRSASAGVANIKFEKNETEDTAAFQLALADGSFVQGISTMAASRERAAAIEIIGTGGRRRVTTATGLGFVAACRRSLVAFCEAARGGAAPATSGSACMDITRTVEALYRAAEHATVVWLSDSESR
jgi:predicted dehydrogenase